MPPCVASLLAPVLPEEKDYEMLLALLKSNFVPKPLAIAESFRFYEQNQSSTKSMVLCAD